MRCANLEGNSVRDGMISEGTKNQMRWCHGETSLNTDIWTASCAEREPFIVCETFPGTGWMVILIMNNCFT